MSVCCEQVVIKEKVLELLVYFTKHEDEEVKTKAIIGLGKNTFFSIYNKVVAKSLSVSTCTGLKWKDGLCVRSRRSSPSRWMYIVCLFFHVFILFS